MSDSVLISAISGVSGVIIAYITYRYRNQSTKPKSKDRIDTAFDMYEGLLRQLNADIKRKDAIIADQVIEIARLKGVDR